MTDLFSENNTVSDSAPLAARMRPSVLTDYHGQEHILGPDKALRLAIEKGQLHSMILWGPPGVGKTTLARLLANEVDAHFLTLSAVLSGVKDIRLAVEQAEHERMRSGKGSILFVDEVHRFNKSQQDAFLPYVEEGTVTFIGATTENPSFEVNNALLSRCRVYVLQPLSDEALSGLITQAMTDQHKGLGKRQIRLDQDSRAKLIHVADGDARRLLNLLEIASDLIDDGGLITNEVLTQVLGNELRRYDKGGDLFYDQISALHKSVRGSDPDAALYWFVRMLDGGCDPLYIARRVVRMASEDIGNADPRALSIALDAWQIQERLGSPEGELSVAQAIVYLACAAKSNAVYTAFKQAQRDVSSQASHPVPMHLRNAPTKLMKSLDHGKGYRYAHDEPDGFAAGEVYFPEALIGTEYYQPVERGLEIKIGEKLRHLRALNQRAGQSS